MRETHQEASWHSPMPASWPVADAAIPKGSCALTMSIAPMEFEWNGEAMMPLHPRVADRQYVVGERYRLAPLEQRSMNSHNHFFSALAEGWRNLPDDLTERFPSIDHLRKFALIKAGFRDERSIVCASKAEALRLASFILPLDIFAVVIARETTVTVLTAKSQSMRAMGKQDFEASKQAVLDLVAGMVGVTADTLKANAGKAA